MKTWSKGSRRVWRTTCKCGRLFCRCKLGEHESSQFRMGFFIMPPPEFTFQSGEKFARKSCRSVMTPFGQDIRNRSEWWPCWKEAFIGPICGMMLRGTWELASLVNKTKLRNCSQRACCSLSSFQYDLGQVWVWTSSHNCWKWMDFLA